MKQARQTIWHIKLAYGASLRRLDENKSLSSTGNTWKHYAAETKIWHIFFFGLSALDATLSHKANNRLCTTSCNTRFICVKRNTWHKAVRYL